MSEAEFTPCTHLNSHLYSELQTQGKTLGEGKRGRRGGGGGEEKRGKREGGGQRKGGKTLVG